MSGTSIFVIFVCVHVYVEVCLGAFESMHFPLKTQLALSAKVIYSISVVYRGKKQTQSNL